MNVAYRYGEASAIGAEGRLALVTCDAKAPGRPFFRGRVLAPEAFSSLLGHMARVAAARYFVPMSALKRDILLDPLVTHADMLRFEAFSGCCSAYARLDVLPEALDGEILGHGTTNVDLNAPTQAGLARIRSDASLTVEVGLDHLALETTGTRLQERRVTLPARWLPGLLSAQFIQAGMAPVFSVAASAMLAFLRTVAHRGGRQSGGFVVADASALRLTPARRAGACPVAGAERLHLLAPALRHAATVHVFADDTGASLWVAAGPAVRFSLLLTPAPDRGFSGEGRALEALAAPPPPAAARLEADLAWHRRVGVAEVAALVGASDEDAHAVLARLGAHGLVGHDRLEGAWFRRGLPFDRGAPSREPARLARARALASDAKVTRLSPDEALVVGDAATYRVRRVGGTVRCDCAWHLKHGDTRGPCAHILAAGLSP